MSAKCDTTTGRLSDLAHTLGAADLARFAYSTNAVGSITRIAEPAASDRNFGYDALQRLVSGGTVALPESYSYDAEGNRLVSHLSAAHTTDDGNRLLQDDQFDYTYDDNGNLATKTDRVTLDVTSYSYDAQDQLVRIGFPEVTDAGGSSGAALLNLRGMRPGQPPPAPPSGHPAAVQARRAARATGPKPSSIRPRR